MQIVDARMDVVMVATVVNAAVATVATVVAVTAAAIATVIVTAIDDHLAF